LLVQFAMGDGDSGRGRGVRWRASEYRGGAKDRTNDQYVSHHLTFQWCDAS
jgi:hypothetical protein